MAQHVVAAAGPPTEAPPSQGAHYIDTNTGEIYLANGTASVDDWLLGGGGGVTGGVLYRAGGEEDGSAQQIIEKSTDGGQSWEALEETPDSVGTQDIGSFGHVQAVGDIIVADSDF